MLQPFEKLLPVYVEKLEALNKKFFVSQSYNRGRDPFAEHPATPILVTVYDNPGLAKTHWNAVRVDPMAAIIDINRPEHKHKLYEMLEGSMYVLYWSVVRSRNEVEQRINAHYKEHMRRYIEKNTNWKIARQASLQPSVQLVFGELYINLKYGSQLIRIKFEEIEKV